MEWNHDQDHVHIMFKAQPKTELTKFINAYKSANSRLIKHDYPRVKPFLWKEMFWSRSFCLFTTGGALIDVIKKYIQNQEDNHNRKQVSFMEGLKTYKFRIYPTEEQEIFWLCPQGLQSNA